MEPRSCEPKISKQQFLSRTFSFAIYFSQNCRALRRSRTSCGVSPVWPQRCCRWSLGSRGRCGGPLVAAARYRRSRESVPRTPPSDLRDMSVTRNQQQKKRDIGRNTDGKRVLKILRSKTEQRTRPSPSYSLSLGRSCSGSRPVDCFHRNKCGPASVQRILCPTPCSAECRPSGSWLRPGGSSRERRRNAARRRAPCNNRAGPHPHLNQKIRDKFSTQ